MASSKKATASLFNNMSSIQKQEDTKKEQETVTKEDTNNIVNEKIEKEITDSKVTEPENTIKELKEPIETEKITETIKKDIPSTDKSNAGRKTVSFTTPGEIKDKLQRYSIAFPDSISQYITDLIIKDFEQNESKYEEIATLLEKVKGLR